MYKEKQIPVVDLFAGPGGLGEGLSSLHEGEIFKTIVSAEMESSAHQTLRLRSFFRILKSQNNKALECYYKFCNGETSVPWDQNTLKAWEDAGNEARQITLGTPEGNHELTQILEKSGIGSEKPWVLIGGPPCQAYSLVGRARNRGKSNYRAEDDHRHFLYKEYLKIIHTYQPAIFVMENVKGILSSKIQDQHIFHTILKDLASPNKALGVPQGKGYRIHSLVNETVFSNGMDPSDIDLRDFIIRSENYGVPQARHRIILLGIREDIEDLPRQLNNMPQSTLHDVLSTLPRLRSKLSKEQDTNENWYEVIKKNLKELSSEAKKRSDLKDFVQVIESINHEESKHLGYGSLRLEKQKANSSLSNTLTRWYEDESLNVWLNHETRGHMSSDLRRYLFASCYAKAYEISPKGHDAFNLPGLRPDHKNWESGKFADRFRVQLANNPSSTITSHISKDGHYFIHPDPSQCRSLTVREAARLQTFPDNYFFLGNRTQQFHQVGNAVPPLLAQKIAEVVYRILK